MANLLNNEYKRARRIFATDAVLEAGKVPRKVVNWAFEYHDHLHELYEMIQTYCDDRCLFIFDKASFPAFCACVARLSSINAPRTNQELVYDFDNKITKRPLRKGARQKQAQAQKQAQTQTKATKAAGV
jgi:hypothetical protein